VGVAHASAESGDWYIVLSGQAVVVTMSRIVYRLYCSRKLFSISWSIIPIVTILDVCLSCHLGTSPRVNEMLESEY